MFIILPEGLLNLPAYRDFRDWLLGKVWLSQTISLPAGAFQPFGRSASKTCILAVIKTKPRLSPRRSWQSTRDGMHSKRKSAAC